MTWTLVRLKLTLLRNGLRRSPWQLVAFVVTALWALGLVIGLGSGLVALRLADVSVAAPVVVGAGSFAVLGWAVLPLVAFGVDETLDPARFATFALRRRDLVTGLLLAGVVGVPGVATLLLALLTVVTFARSVPAALLALVAALLAALTAVAASRTTTTAAAAVLRARRGRDVLVVVGGAVAVLAGPGLNIALQRAGDVTGAARSAAGVLGWTPLGFAWAAAADGAAGSWGTAVLRLVLAALTLLGLLAVWAAALGRSGTGPAAGSSGRTAPASRRAGVLDRLPASVADPATVAVAGRCLSYWRRDPRYVVSAVSLVVLPLLLLVAPLSQGSAVGPWLLAAGPLAAFVAGWSLHNDVAFDHSAFALHVSSGLRGRHDRAGRVLAAAVWQVPVLVVLSVVGVLVAGRPGLLPAVLGASAAFLGAGAGVSSVASALAPYPAPAPGANPFQTPKGAALATVVAQFVTSTLTAVLGLPALALAVVEVAGWGGGGAAPSWAGWAALVVGLGTGALWVRLGVGRGGAVLDRRAPEVLATVSRS